MVKFLIESALLVHGLESVSNEELLKAWPSSEENIVWVDKGMVTIGSIRDFCQFRDRKKELIRINCNRLDEAINRKQSGALTASGTMEICYRKGIPLAISCGIGGIGDIKGEQICPDLPALQNIPVNLLCTSFKDMLDIPGSIKWLKKAGIPIFGIETDRCTGYIFNSANVPVDGALEKSCDGMIRAHNHGLFLNPIPPNKRIQDISLLDIGIRDGKEAEKRGLYYHPAVNRAFDRETLGYSSRIQLEALIANVLLAEKLLIVYSHI